MSPAIERVERTPVRVPFRDRPEHHLRREHASYNSHDIYEVTLSDGSVGYGESRIRWPLGDREEEYDVVGRDAFSVLWDDAIPQPIQHALFDAVGRSGGPRLPVAGREATRPDAAGLVVYGHDQGGLAGRV
jgi:L-alanine-DL-glutamate epimerase-like enolase superfamily enzyme